MEILGLVAIMAVSDAISFGTIIQNYNVQTVPVLYARLNLSYV
jgi:hypothetical protein